MLIETNNSKRKTISKNHVWAEIEIRTECTFWLKCLHIHSTLKCLSEPFVCIRSICFCYCYSFSFWFYLVFDAFRSKETATATVVATTVFCYIFLFLSFLFFTQDNLHMRLHKRTTTTTTTIQDNITYGIVYEHCVNGNAKALAYSFRF